jgi:hypothetical protein
MSGRVMAAVRAGAAEAPELALDTPPPDRRSDGPRRWASVVGGLALGVAAAGVVWALWPRAPRSGPTSGHVIAAAPSKISLAPGTNALLAGGADVRWQRDGSTLAVTHAAGGVTYEHTGPSRLVITTPGATVSTARATLHLEVPVNKHIVSGAAGAAIAAAAVIAVYEGRAEVRQPAAAPRVIESGAQVALAAPAPDPRPAFQPIAKVARDRAQRDALASAIAAVRSRTAAAAAALPAGGGGGPGSVVAPAPGPAPAPPVDATPGQLSKEEIREGVKEVVPLLVDCYETMLEHDPTFNATVTARLVVDSEPELGSIVSLRDPLDVEVVTEQTLVRDDLREFNECMTATLEAVVLPPLGDKDGGRVEITYPFVFQPAPVAQKPAPAPKPKPAGVPEPIAETAEELLALSESAAKRSQWARALKYAEESFAAPGAQPPTIARAAMVAALAACNVRNATKARRYYVKATPSSRTLVEQRCLSNGITVKDAVDAEPALRDPFKPRPASPATSDPGADDAMINPFGR